MSLDQVRHLEQRFGSGVYPQRDLLIVRGLGAVLWDEKGRAYLDMGANYGVANVGHCHPKVVAAITQQAQRLIYVSPTFLNDQRALMLQRLASTMPAGSGLVRAFPCNSGAEANEAAVKFAVAATGRTGLVAAKRSYHGRTLAALGLTFNPKYRSVVRDLIPKVTHVTYDDPEALKGAVSKETALVILEPLQGEGGIHVASAEYLRTARDLCIDHGALLAFDEVQCGLGRTGRMWACEHAKVSPDLLSLSKSIAGGLPMGALMMTEQVAAAMPKTGHGSTFSGNPLTAAAALAVLDVLEHDHLIEHAAHEGAHLLFSLRRLADELPIGREGRGMGLMCALELRKKCSPYLNALVGAGIIALPAGATVIRFLPPLVISREQLDEAIGALERVLRSEVSESGGDAEG